MSPQDKCNVFKHWWKDSNILRARGLVPKTVGSQGTKSGLGEVFQGTSVARWTGVLSKRTWGQWQTDGTKVLTPVCICPRRTRENKGLVVLGQ
jgi:hypothetical protein